jgi:hypothetical protein
MQSIEAFGAKIGHHPFARPFVLRLLRRPGFRRRHQRLGNLPQGAVSFQERLGQRLDQGWRRIAREKMARELGRDMVVPRGELQEPRLQERPLVPEHLSNGCSEHQQSRQRLGGRSGHRRIRFAPFGLPCLPLRTPGTTLDPAGQRPDADLVNTGQQPEDTVVVRLRSVFAKANRLFKLVAVDLGRFVGVSHFGDGAHGRLRRQPEVIPKALVNDLLQVELADLLGSQFLKPQLRCRIAGSVARLKSLPKQFCLVLRRCQLDIGHSSFKYRNCWAKYQVPRFLSNQARAVVGASAWRFQVNVRRWPTSAHLPRAPMSSVI